jgi:hypothetical protein
LATAFEINVRLPSLMDLLVTLHKQVEQVVPKNMTDRIAEAHGYYLLEAKVAAKLETFDGTEK